LTLSLKAAIRLSNSSVFEGFASAGAEGPASCFSTGFSTGLSGVAAKAAPKIIYNKQTAMAPRAFIKSPILVAPETMVRKQG
jgi:hypothetical protein